MELDHPRRLLGILKEISFRKDSIEKFRKIVDSLDASLLGTLITLLVDWNTNAKHSDMVQTVLYVIFRRYDLSDLIKLTPSHLHRRGKGFETDANEGGEKIINLQIPELVASRRAQNVAQILSALDAYSMRHLKRVNRLIQNSYLLDFILNSMGIIQPKMDHFEEESSRDGDGDVEMKEMIRKRKGNNFFEIATVEDIENKRKEGNKDILSFLEGLEDPILRDDNQNENENENAEIDVSKMLGMESSESESEETEKEKGGKAKKRKKKFWGAKKKGENISKKRKL